MPHHGGGHHGGGHHGGGHHHGGHHHHGLAGHHHHNRGHVYVDGGQSLIDYNRHGGGWGYRSSRQCLVIGIVVVLVLFISGVVLVSIASYSSTNLAIGIILMCVGVVMLSAFVRNYCRNYNNTATITVVASPPARAQAAPAYGAATAPAPYNPQPPTNPGYSRPPAAAASTGTGADAPPPYSEAGKYR